MPDISLTEINKYIKKLLLKLPKDSPIAKELEDATRAWFAIVNDASNYRPYIDPEKNNEITQQTEEISFEKAQKIEPLESENPSIAESQEKVSISIETVTEDDVPESSYDNKSKDLWDKIVRDDAEIPSDQGKLGEELLRWYCWRLANCSQKKQIEDYMRLWEESPYENPREDDIVIRGTCYTFEDIPRVWICPAKKIPLFSSYLPNVISDANIWLSFSDSPENFELRHFFYEIKDIKELTEHSDALPLWYRWHDFLYWAIMAPDATVFVNNKLEKLSQDRENICKTLFRIYPNFEYALQNPDKNCITNSLHQVYSAFHQFLFPKDLDTKKVHKNVFSILRDEARNNIEKWLAPLQVDELHPAGPLLRKRVESFASVKDKTDKNANTQIPAHDLLLKNYKDAEDGRVLYWLKPRWKQKNPPKGQSPDLLGSVLYCLD